MHVRASFAREAARGQLMGNSRGIAGAPERLAAASTEKLQVRRQKTASRLGQNNWWPGVGGHHVCTKRSGSAGWKMKQVSRQAMASLACLRPRGGGGGARHAHRRDWPRQARRRCRSAGRSWPAWPSPGSPGTAPPRPAVPAPLAVLQSGPSQRVRRASLMIAMCDTSPKLPTLRQESLRDTSAESISTAPPHPAVPAQLRF